MQGLDKNICQHPNVGIALEFSISNNSILTLGHLMHDVHLRKFIFLGTNEYKHFW